MIINVLMMPLALIHDAHQSADPIIVALMPVAWLNNTEHVVHVYRAMKVMLTLDVTRCNVTATTIVQKTKVVKALHV